MSILYKDRTYITNSSNVTTIYAEYSQGCASIAKILILLVLCRLHISANIGPLLGKYQHLNFGVKFHANAVHIGKYLAMVIADIGLLLGRKYVDDMFQSVLKFFFTKKDKHYYAKSFSESYFTYMEMDFVVNRLNVFLIYVCFQEDHLCVPLCLSMCPCVILKTAEIRMITMGKRMRYLYYKIMTVYTFIRQLHIYFRCYLEHVEILRELGIR